jgi:hypothetical protein
MVPVDPLANNTDPFVNPDKLMLFVEVIVPLTDKFPVTVEFPCEIKPFLITNSFGISFPYPRLLYKYN